MSASFYLLSTLIVGFITYNLHRNWRARAFAQAEFEQRLHDSVDVVLGTSQRSQQDSFGVYTFEGMWRDNLVQIRYISDTLATRKLPTFWMSVTIFHSIPIEGVYDLLNRPAGLASFSNFHLLPFVLKKPLGLYEQCELRSDMATMPSDRVPVGFIQFMQNPYAKELLVSPKGVRVVWTVAEADRLRYGVFRNADFNEVKIESDLIQQVLENAHSVTDVMTENNKEVVNG